jgi:hypothetical protein
LIRLALALGCLVAGAAGCLLVYDLGTGGYSLAEEAGIGFADCGADATCPDLSLSCLGTEDCGDGGMACCLSLVGGSVQSRCSTTGCSGAIGQLCKSTAECSGSLRCVSQTCSSVGGATVGLQACGQLPIPSCTP